MEKKNKTLDVSKSIPLIIWYFKFLGFLNDFLEKKEINNKVKIVLKKKRNQVTCNTGKEKDKYFAIASINGSINQAVKFKIYPLIKENILRIKI